MSHTLKTLLITLISVTSLQAQAKITTRTVTIPSGPKKMAIKVEIFEPTGKGPHPAVMLVHGADGLAKWRKEYVKEARGLAQIGCVVLLPHYFDRTGHEKVNKALIRAHFFDWGDTLRDALLYCKALPNVRRNQVGILSYSLGSFLSTWLAARASDDKERIQCLVEAYGGFPSEVVLVKPSEMLRLNFKRIPPTLIIHSEKDPVVSVQEAHKLEKLLKANMVPCEKKIYPGAYHPLRGEAAKDARSRTLKFFSTHFKLAKK